jgi:adenosylcobinamide-phosphate synthase
MDRSFLTIIALVSAYLLDFLIGDPPWLPHPVRLIGSIISSFEKLLRRICKKAAALKMGGLVLVIVIAGGSAVLVYLIITAAYRTHPAAGFVIELYFYFAVLAGGDLRNHLSRVEKVLVKGNLEEGRSKVAMLVSRDTESLNSEELSRAALESLFENSSDGLVAPLVYAAVGGPAAAFFYKAVSTMDSMIGYKNKDYKALGFAAAKLDDLLNYIPARLTALLILIAGSAEKTIVRAWRVLLADRHKHESPNSAWPEAAAAGVLNVRLGGEAVYSGVARKRPVINATGREAGAEDIAAGIRLFQRTSILALIILSSFAYWLLLLEVGKF